MKNIEKSNFADRKTHDRIWEIDALRGVAVFFMVFFHLMVDLRDFYGYNILYYNPPGSLVGRVSALMFMFISGISCSLSSGNIKRGAKVFLIGMVVTVATFFYVPELYIRFGILHFLGSSMVLWGLIEKAAEKKKVKLAISIICIPISIVLGVIFDQVRVKNPYLFFLGLITPDFSTYDFYPLIPWIGVFLAGVAFGITFYKDRRKSLFRFAPVNMPKPAALFVRALMITGKKSLVIYVAHQPLMIAILFLIHRFIINRS